MILLVAMLYLNCDTAKDKRECIECCRCVYSNSKSIECRRVPEKEKNVTGPGQCFVSCSKLKEPKNKTCKVWE